MSTRLTARQRATRKREAEGDDDATTTPESITSSAVAPAPLPGESSVSLASPAKVRRTAAVTQPTMERFSRRLVASAEETAAKAARENPFELEWHEHETMLYLTSRVGASGDKAIRPSDKVASFDMDGTLIRTSSGRLFPVSRRDWLWLVAEVPKKLRALHEDGWKVVIFTNQNGISTGKQSANDIKGKILDIIKDAGFPIQAFVATADDLYRKPSTDMWRYMTAHHNGGVVVDQTCSVYVGDAAGRAAGWNGAGAKKDFSASDRKFAFNVALGFHTPEEYFLGHAPAKFSWGGIDPTAIRPVTGASATPAAAAAAAGAAGAKTSASASSAAAFSQQTGPYHDVTGSLEVVLFCGLPAAGKSTFARTHFLPHGYAHVNQDTLKTKEKCVKATIAALAAGRSVVVDNTNPSVEVRALYIAEARAHSATVRCFHFQTAEEVAKHLNMYREKLSNGAHRHVPRIAYASFKKNFVTPHKKEGFTEVRAIDFVATFPTTKEGEAAKKLFYELS